MELSTIPPLKALQPHLLSCLWTLLRLRLLILLLQSSTIAHQLLVLISPLQYNTCMTCSRRIETARAILHLHRSEASSQNVSSHIHYPGNVHTYIQQTLRRLYISKTWMNDLDYKKKNSSIPLFEKSLFKWLQSSSWIYLTQRIASCTSTDGIVLS